MVVAVEQGCPGEPRVVPVDRTGQRHLSGPRRHRRRGHRDPVVHPDRGVAGEQQVGQGTYDELAGSGHAGDDALGSVVRQLLVRESRGDHPREVVTRQAEEHLAQDGGEGRADDGRRDHRVHDLGAGGGVLERLDQQVGEVQDLDAAVLERRRERVVLLLRPRHPRQAVEEQVGVVAGGQALELRTGPVQQDGPERTDLAGDPVHGRTLRSRGLTQRGLRPASAAGPRRTSG